ncbi:TubC_N domain-containing protein [Pseudomonas chlororaphis]
MSTPPVKTLIDEQLAEIERSLAILGAGLPRDLPVSVIPPKLAAAIKGGRIAVRVRP